MRSASFACDWGPIVGPLGPTQVLWGSLPRKLDPHLTWRLGSGFSSWAGGCKTVGGNREGGKLTVIHNWGGGHTLQAQA